MLCDTKLSKKPIPTQPPHSLQRPAIPSEQLLLHHPLKQPHPRRLLLPRMRKLAFMAVPAAASALPLRTHGIPPIPLLALKSWLRFGGDRRRDDDGGRGELGGYGGGRGVGV